MGIWMAANLRKKMELVRSACFNVAVAESELAFNSTVGHESSEIQDPHASTDDRSIEALLEPALAIIGNEHRIYYAYPSSVTGDVTVLGPDEKFGNLSTRSVHGIFKLIRFYATILDYGYEETSHGQESERGLWSDALRKGIDEIGRGV